MIEYVLADPASYCIAISRNSARVIRLASGAKLRASSQALSKSMAAGEPAAASRQMFLQLLAPVSEITRYQQIVIVRDGPLHFVPFEAPESADGQALVDSAAVTYAPSAGALVALMKKNHHRQPFSALAVGGVPYSESSPNKSAFLRGFSNRTFTNLPGSVDEVKTAVAVAPDGQRRLLLGREATESAVKAHLPRFGYLHFAVHGVSDKVNSERAALILLSDESAGEDGILQSSEIMHLKLTADLVTLSACDTSVGALHGHEGIENLSRAFLIAGARAVVSTLWQVNDQSSAYLMKRFYFHLAAKRPPTFALAEAKRDFRRALAHAQLRINGQASYWRADYDRCERAPQGHCECEESCLAASHQHQSRRL